MSERQSGSRAQLFVLEDIQEIYRAASRELAQHGRNGEGRAQPGPTFLYMLHFRPGL